MEIIPIGPNFFKPKSMSKYDVEDAAEWLLFYEDKE
jgi:hypothetical protein